MEPLLQWLRGDLSTPQRVWSALWPVFLIGGYFFGGLAIYTVRTAVYGRYHDADVERRGSSALIGRFGRSYFAWLMRPLFATLYALRIPPDAITTLAVLLSLIAAVAVAAGRFSLGGWIYILSGCCDFFDGRLARQTGSAGPAGAALDSVLDRYSESAVLCGLAWYYRADWVLLCVLLTLTGSFLVSYVRARGEGLGVSVTIGLMQRPERLALLGGSLALSPLVEATFTPHDDRPLHVLTVVVLLVLAVSTHTTALRRLMFLLDELRDRPRLSILSRERGSLFRNIVAASIATAIDFAFVVFLVSRAKFDPAWATALGCALGGVVGFVINRTWTFSTNGAARTQAVRYAFASATTAGLNTAGVAVLLFLPDLAYQLAWLLVRIAVFVGWSYPLHRTYVFEHAAVLAGADLDPAQGDA